MALMERNFANPDGTVSERTIAHYRERAEGGVGWIDVESTFVEAAGRGRTHQLGLHEDRCPRELTVAEIDKIVERYALAAARAVAAGFDAVEMHSAHGYPPLAFLSPLTNRRFSAEEHVPGGLTLADTITYARALEQAGVDYASPWSGPAGSWTRAWRTARSPRAGST